MRTKRLNLSLESSYHAQIAKAAKSLGLSIAAFARMAIYEKTQAVTRKVQPTEEV